MNTKLSSSFPINMKHSILFVLQYHRETKKKNLFFFFFCPQRVLYGICATFPSWTFNTHINPKAQFSTPRSQVNHSDVAFRHSHLLCIGYLWFEHSWTTWAFPSFCLEPLLCPFLDLRTPLLFPSLTCTPLSFIYVVGLAAASVYCWCLSLCTDCCSLLM